MGNDRKINPTDGDPGKALAPTNKQEIITRAKKIFLEEPAKRIEEKVRRHETYYIENEFPKLNKNKNITVRILLAGFVIAFLTIAFWGTNYFIELKSKEIEINISDFASIDVANLVGDVASLKNKILEKQTQADELEYEYNTKQEAIVKQKKFDILDLQEKELPKAQHAVELKKIENTAKQATAKLSREYSVVTEAKKELLLLEEELSQKNIANGQTDEDSGLDSFNRLANVRMDKLRKTYEDKIEDLQSSHNSDTKNIEKRYNALIEQIHSKYQIQLASYKNSVDHYMERLGQVGIVLNVPSYDAIQIYIHPIYSDSMQETNRGYIVNQNNQIIAVVNIYRKYDYFEGKIISTNKNELSIKPLDNVSLDLQVNKN